MNGEGGGFFGELGSHMLRFGRVLQVEGLLGFFLFFVGQSVGGRYGRWTGVSSLYGFICLFGAFLIFFGAARGGLRRGYSAFFSSRSFGIFSWG